MKDKIKFDANSELWVRRKIFKGTQVLSNGEHQRVYATQWEKADKNLDLGSLKNPREENQDIIALEWRDTKVNKIQKNMSDVLGSLFGG